jgi:hypothetical protein
VPLRRSESISYGSMRRTPTASALRWRDDAYMSRLPRPDLPGVAQHVVQRGNNRLTVSTMMKIAGAILRRCATLRHGTRARFMSTF